MSEGAGRPTLLTDEMCTKIRALVISDVTYDEICSSCGFSRNTWDNWKWTNYLGFNDKVTMWEHERKLQKAEARIEDSIRSNDERVALDAAKFVAGTLGRKHYHTKTETEHSGKVGIDLNDEQAKKIAKEVLHGTDETTTDGGDVR